MKIIEISTCLAMASLSEASLAVELGVEGVCASTEMVLMGALDSNTVLVVWPEEVGSSTTMLGCENTNHIELYTLREKI